VLADEGFELCLVYVAPKETAIQATAVRRDRRFNPAEQSEGEIAQFSGLKHDRSTGHNQFPNDYSLTFAAGTLPGYPVRGILDRGPLFQTEAVSARPTLPA
jgi:hypothetical protein